MSSFRSLDWGECTAEQVVDGTRNPLWIYLAAKILAEKEAWKFAAENPTVDLTTSCVPHRTYLVYVYIISANRTKYSISHTRSHICTVNPPFIYGPFVEGLAPTSAAGAGTNRMVYALIAGEKGRAPPMQLSPYYIDVRDVATAHVRALAAPPASEKRFLISGGVFSWKEAAAYLAEARPELRECLPSLEAPGPGLLSTSTISTIDAAPAREMLGLAEYIEWKDTVNATVDSLLTLEKTWV